MSSDYYIKLKVAVYYYEKGLTQQEIADKMHLSRPTISKLLKEAREENIVSIKINDPNAKKRLIDLEYEVIKRFEIGNAFIFEYNNESDEELKVKLGTVAASYFSELIRNNLKIGLVGSYSIKHMIDHLEKDRGIYNVEVVALTGGSQNFPPGASANVLCNKLVNKYNGIDYHLYTPLLVDTEEIKNMLLGNREVKAVLSKAKNLDVILLPIGHRPDEDSNLYKSGYYSEEEIKEIEEKGAVGDIAGRFIRADGSICKLSVNERVIGINLEDIKKTKEVIGIAGGYKKVEAILGALKGGYIKTLIADSNTCEKILSIDNG